MEMLGTSLSLSKDVLGKRNRVLKKYTSNVLVFARDLLLRHFGRTNWEVLTAKIIAIESFEIPLTRKCGMRHNDMDNFA